MTIYSTIDDYDVRAIAQEMTEWQDHANAAFNGFVEREGIDFWDIAAKHETN